MREYGYGFMTDLRLPFVKKQGTQTMSLKKGQTYIYSSPPFQYWADPENFARYKF